ncbi:MAG: endolytic transglycosylase MltG [Lonepinella koalarum]|nr:endolytic transglycosylase MltG [Lonepinella koalarum]
MKKQLYLIFILLISCGALTFWTYQQIQQVIQQPITTQPNQLLTLERGTTGKKLVALFEQEKLVSDATWLPYALKLNPDLGNVKAGTYSLNGIQTVKDLLVLLNSGKEAQFSIRFTEGETWTQVFKSIENAPHLKKVFNYNAPDCTSENTQTCKISFVERQIFSHFNAKTKLIDDLSKTMVGSKKLEGWIYPDTYYYTPNSSDEELLKRAILKMKTTLDKAWESRNKDLPLNNKYEMLILASIVEKESGMEAERGKIASVFINRLKLKMKLQTDPTVIYGMGDEYQGNIRKKDLETPTPYNTYVIEGLPPTPIANPSESALMAVAQPEKTDLLYFVANGRGGHKFSRTLAEHNRAVQEYLRWYRENKK